MLSKPVSLSELVDRRFVPRDIARRDIVPALASATEVHQEN